MKSKNVAIILACFFGPIGLHRFYLGETGKGVIYLFLSITGLTLLFTLIDVIRYIRMDDDVFDLKYNPDYISVNRFERQSSYGETTGFDRFEWQPIRRQSARRSNYKPRKEEFADFDAKQMNPYKASGLQRYKDFEYEDAIKDFNKVLEKEPKDISTHYNLACAHSMLEQAEEGFYHLRKAIELGFKDYNRIENHDALSYLRTLDEFETIYPNADSNLGLYSTPTGKPEMDLLEQLQELGKLRERGILTEAEFVSQKKKLLG